MSILTVYEETKSAEVVEEFVEQFDTGDAEIYPERDYRVKINQNILSDGYKFKIEQYSSDRRTPHSRMSAGTNKGPDILAKVFQPNTFRGEWKTKAEGNLENLEKARKLLQ